MASVKFLNRCAGGNHFDVEITTEKGVVIIPVVWNEMKATKNIKELKEQIISNIKTRIKDSVDFDSAKTLCETVPFQE